MNPSRRAIGLLVLTVAFAILPYLPVLSYGFVYDDHAAIEENDQMRIWPGLGRIFFSDVWALGGAATKSNYYRPMFMLAYEGVFHIVGPSPWAFHLLNLLFHAASTVMVFLLARRLWESDSVASIAAILFALHPGHVEAVAWIAALSEVGFTFFVLLALYFYVQEPSPRWSAALWLSSFGMALLWKESGIAFALLAVSYDVVVLRRFRWRRWLGIAGVTLCYVGIRAIALRGLAPLIFRPNLSPATQILTAISNIGFYVEKLAFPRNLSVSYPIELVSGVNASVLLVAVLAIAAAWKLRGKTAWSALWIVVGLLPVLAVSRIAVPLADRNLYLSSVGFTWLAAIVLTRLGSKGAVALAAIAAVAYGGLTLRRLPDWRNDMTLFQQVLQDAPDSNSARLAVASELGRQGKHKEAMVHVAEVLQRDPRNVEGLISMAGLQVYMQDWPGVRASCAAAFAIDPKLPRCMLYVGYAHEHAGNLREAREEYGRAFRLYPRFWQALLRMGLLDAQLGNLSVAAEELEMVVKHDPTAAAFNNLGSVYANRGEMPRAVDAFREAVRLDPSFEAARRNLEMAIRDSH